MRMHFLVAAVLCWLGVMASGSAAQQPSSSGQQAAASVSEAAAADRRSRAITVYGLGQYLAAQVGADTARLKLKHQGPIFTSGTIVQR